MKLYLASLGAGLVVGIVYSLLQVRSPAPPVIALLGLFGILVGEQVVPVARHLWNGESLARAIGLVDAAEQVLGRRPEAPRAAEDHHPES